MRERERGIEREKKEREIFLPLGNERGGGVQDQNPHHGVSSIDENCACVTPLHSEKQ